jgi:hypothetical protein
VSFFAELWLTSTDVTNCDGKNVESGTGQDVFPFDEPLSNLDAALRTQMRIELINLHARLKTTLIYVTHDQVRR